ncbi:Glycerate kinase [Croceitalea dokdonensis DOKDO 023]|uniref:Glycerate kinase n=1 Tax=Croceitalea dokdonensis DOKDO 023 TaxID=1300341 RepID=A0A0P7A9Z0_9FLAO|nr:glycerate kinase [Croceitalea dokdonensis]KPM33710.1 Glycerate kinase [Croceitalea dokdonensis DOKDO 023]
MLDKFLLLPDKFKGSLTAEEVISAMEEGISTVFPRAKISSRIASDGGDGFQAAISKYLKVTAIDCETVNALGQPIYSSFLFDGKSKSAYIELASASGLAQLPVHKRNPLITSTFGTGLQIKKAIAMGAKTIYVGLGGSATNDGGLGIAHALGYKFFDSNGALVRPMGKQLGAVTDFKPPKPFKEISFYAVNDVDNPLCGDNGASVIYGPQKGATPKAVLQLEEGLTGLSALVEKRTGTDYGNIPGAGAAGGAAFGLKAFFNAEFLSGIEFMFNVMKVQDLLETKQFDYIFTGEGRMDEQTLNGKLIAGVYRLGLRYGVPVVAFCGKVDLEEDVLRNHPGLQLVEIGDGTKSLTYNMENAHRLLSDTVSDYLKNP